MEMIMIENKQDNVNANIIDILSTSNILTLHNINNKKQLFTKIADSCEQNINTSKSKFLSALLDKEINENSGIGEGVAIPNIQTDAVKNMFGVFIKWTTYMYTTLHIVAISMLGMLNMYRLLYFINTAVNHIE